MDLEDQEQINLTGSLLIADPSLRDPGFGRSVVLVSQHKATEGATGFILNKPLGKSVSDLVTLDEFDALAEVPVYLGGPVSTEQLTFASMTWRQEECTLDYETHLSSEDAAHRMAEGFSIRAFVGYSGWSEGQLESEIQGRSWIIKKPDEPIADVGLCQEELWGEQLRSMGPYYQMLADSPDNPSLN
ncbi:MAG: putative transcriptional regulator [Verrucomicrobiales bacterium]|jgi:putative transcriptional regulator